MVRQDFISMMPPVRNKQTVNHSNGANHDIIQTIHQNFPEAVRQTKKIAPYFKRATTEETCKTLWTWLKTNIKYKRDGEDAQLIRLPNVFVSSKTGDCKSYSLFTASILFNLGIHCAFRYSSYNGSGIPTHVYVVTTGALPLVVDAANPVNTFGYEKAPSSKKDYKVSEIMKIATLSGYDSVKGKETTTPALSGIDIYGHEDYIGRPSLSKAVRLQNKATHQLNKQKNAGLRADRLARKANKQQMVVSQEPMLVTNDINGIYDDINGIGRIRLRDKIKNVAKRVTNTAGAKRFVQRATNTAGAKRTLKKAGDLAKKGLTKLKTVAKKGGLAPARGAFLKLVGLNVKHLATNLDKLVQKNRGALESTWKKLGGDFNVLLSTINKGKQRKGLFGYEAPVYGIGADPATIAAIVTAAAPIIVIIVKLIATHVGKKKELAQLDKEANDSGGLDSNGREDGGGAGTDGGNWNTGGDYSGGGGSSGGGSSSGGGFNDFANDGATPPPGSDGDGAGSGFSFKPSPMMIGIGLLGAYLIFKPKSR